MFVSEEKNVPCNFVAITPYANASRNISLKKASNMIGKLVLVQLNTNMDKRSVPVLQTQGHETTDA